MDTHEPDLSLLLPGNTYYQLIHTLKAAMPLPLADTQEALLHRDNAAMAEVASLAPVNAEEAGVAADYVLSRAYMNHCFRQASAREADFEAARKCIAMATSLMRQSGARRSLLLRIQTARLKRRGDHEAVDGAAWAEDCALHMMAEAARSARARWQEPNLSSHGTKSRVVVNEMVMRRPRTFSLPAT